MMNCVRIAPFLLLAAGTALAQAPASSQGENQAPIAPVAIKSFDLSAIDKTADPCADFYQYACGSWIKNNPLPGDQVRWARSFSLLQERNRYLLWQELDAASKDPKSPLQKKYGDYFAACMNTDLVEKKGLEPVDPALKQIAALSDTKSVAPLLGELAAEGSPAPLFRFGVQQDEKDSSKQIASIGQGGLSLPDRDYYLLDRFEAIRKQYVEHMTKMFTLAGDTPDQAAKEADAVLKIETALAKASTSRTESTRSRKALSHLQRSRFSEARPRLRLLGLLQGCKSPLLRHPERGHSRLLQRGERADRLRAGRFMEVVLTLAHPHHVGRRSSQGFSRRGFLILRQSAGRAEGTDPALAALHRDDRPGARAKPSGRTG